MKKVKAILVAAFVAVCASVSAQENFGWGYLQYNISNLKVSYSGYSDSESYNTVTLGYNYDINIMPDYDLYLEVGGAAQWYFKSKDDVTTNMISLKVPVSVMYSIPVSDNFRIEPYAGLYARFNVYGSSKEKGGESINIFSDDDMWGEACKRFQFGLHAGVRARISEQFLVGIGYSQDLNEFAEHTKFNSIDTTVGLKF